jgi:hypothetical protein
MSKKLYCVDWKTVSGAASKKRMLKFQRNSDELYPCPVATCLHIGFKSDRGARKHINTAHPWYFYFDQQPLVTKSEFLATNTAKRKVSTHKVPAFSLAEGMGKEFLDWLKTPCGGGKSTKQAVQSARRSMKFLMASLGDTEVEKHVSDEFMDCCLGSPAIIINFIKVITEYWKVSSSAALNYMKSIGDLMDFRKANGVTDDVLRSFTVGEVYIRRGKENLSKKKRVEYSRNLDLEQLICRQSWASVEEMEEVIPYHSPKYQHIIKKCKESNSSPSISELAFATRFIATFLFLRVKCTRPMTYQFITLQMVEDAKKNGGYIDQTSFKTEKEYAFDTVVLSKEVLKILDSYISIIRPRLKPTCNYLVLTTNGKQYSAFGSAMSLLVHQAIEKYVNPTRYRQIIESESAERLTREEMEAVSKDQKHSSYVARRIYQKKLSREVAEQGRSCMEKIAGMGRNEHTKVMANDIADAALSATGEHGEQNFSPCNDGESSGSSDLPEVEEVMSLDGGDKILPKEEDGIVEMQPTPTVHGLQEVENPPEISIEVKKELQQDFFEGAVQKRFSAEEDSVLREGIKKYGLGKWSEMLKDSTLKFHPRRTRDSIRVRADTLGLTKKKVRKSRRRNAQTNETKKNN